MRAGTAFLSVRVPADLRGRLKAVAARRGISLQQLMREGIEELLMREEAEPPKLAEVIAKLRAHAPELRKRGVEHLYVFGSVARGDARVDSDVDLAIDVDRTSRFSLVTEASIGRDLEELLQRRVDIGTRASLRPSLHEDFERDAVRVF
jgi:predicted nucleotidyltransferase